MSTRIEHPGVELGRRIQDAGLNMTQFAYAIKVSPSRISELVSGKRGITVDSAIRIANIFKTSPEFWLSKQVEYDLSQTQIKNEQTRMPSWMTA